MPPSLPPQLLQSLRLLIRANHILHHHNLVDAFGHISIRHPFAPDQYILAAYDPGAPALVKSRDDFIAYRISDSSPVDDDAPQGYSERFIHGEVLKRFPNAKCVVHSHSDVVVPFTLAKTAVRPVVHMAGFLGAEPVPVFKVPAEHDLTHDILIKTRRLGQALASMLTTDQPVVLQHQHGFTTFGDSVEQAVYRAVYTQTNCRLLAQALVFAGGDPKAVDYLTPEQARACARMNEKCQDKSWRLWIREVQVLRLYANEEGEPDGAAVGGMRV
ncbi:arad-like aldolase/epimerase [Dothidotthia symphoricarpi CBS 119687]|uniref:Arad-like aldolase/epimerase n=1 Tax=Dothidotthia symphoricarpi CBS 119687 TaxID=1392245 RepID=A0A6A6AEZ9_9PLEO|nr:arad-like aldolase/epimerase [Dothidotthia symphoricarpi CBS 119687]KAF2130380.1 arad-like aldolase/epimerase [Dothidotthia symphoricarpi CBS 119687]